MRFTSALVLACCASSLCAAQQGYIQRETDGKFLTCTTSACTWADQPTQQFKKVAGGKGQHRFHIYQSDGTDTTQCLDRVSCHHGSSRARMGNCDHCGAIHWDYADSKLAEDHMKNCIQNDGNIGHCSQSHEAIKWPVTGDCKPKATLITDVKCKNEKDDGTCGADFEKGSTVGAHSDHDCDACQAAAGSTEECDFSFSRSTTHTVSTTFSSSTAIMAGTEFNVGMSFAVKAVGTVKFSVTETLTYGHTKSTTTSSTVTGGCKATIKAGTRESASANYFSGTLMGDFTATQTTEYDCGWKKSEKKPITGTITISNVPTQSMVGTCKTVAGQCPAANPEEDLFPQSAKSSSLRGAATQVVIAEELA